jgi:DNA-binding CsgD family transcriptional regulator
MNDTTDARLVMLYHDILSAMLDAPESFVDTLTRQIAAIIPCHGIVMVVVPDAHEMPEGARAENVAHVMFDLKDRPSSTDVTMRSLDVERGHIALDDLVAGAEHDLAAAMDARMPGHGGLFIHWIRHEKEPHVAAAIFRVYQPKERYGMYTSSELRLLDEIRPHLLMCVRVYQELTRARRATFDFFAERCSALAVSSGLTTTEERVLRKMVEGAANKMISNELGISLATVKTHISHILQKTGCRNRTDLIGRHFSSKHAAVGA